MDFGYNPPKSGFGGFYSNTFPYQVVEWMPCNNLRFAYAVE